VLIHGRPFLQYQLSLIKSYGLTRVLILYGYLGDQFKRYFGDGSGFGLDMDIQYSSEKAPMGTGGALKVAEDKLEKEFVLLNGDTYLPIDYAALIESFHLRDKLGIVTAYCGPELTVQNNLKIAESNYIMAYNKRDSTGMTHIDAGVMVFKKEILNLIPEKQLCSLEEKIFEILIKKRELTAFTTTQKFYDMGTFEGLEAAGRFLK